MGGTLDLVKGAARDFLREARDAAGAAFDPDTNPSPFLVTDDLTASVWPGGDLPAVLAPSVTWVDPATGRFRVSVTAAQSAALGAGVYRYQASVSRSGGDAGVLDRGRLSVVIAPGTGTQPLAFTTRDDLLFYTPWLEDLMTELDRLNFASEQVRATNRLIDCLVQMWQPKGGLTQMGLPGWNASTLFGAGSAPPSWWLRQQLVPLAPNSTPPASMPDRQSTPANFVDPTISTALLLYPEVKEICARWAVGYVCGSQIGREGKNWVGLAARFRGEADSLFQSRRFEIDTSDPQTGWGGIVIHGGGASLR